MREFARTINAIDFTTKTSVKRMALTEYLDQATDKDKVWVIALFTHRRPKRTVKTALLREWAAEQAGIPLWLFEETYHIVGDLAETIASLLPSPTAYRDEYSLDYWFQWLLALKDQEEDTKKEKILWAWSVLDKTERFIFNKLITGGFRIGVSANTLALALADHLEQEKSDILLKLTGNWDPYTTTFEQLFSHSGEQNLAKPYPFYLAYPVEEKFFEEENTADWQAEWKWDGIRGQLISRQDTLSLWSRGEELITERFPDITEYLTADIPDVVLDGEIICWQDGKPLPFQLLQTRIGRKSVGKKLLKDAPAAFVVYDILEYNGEDIRHKSMADRRAILEKTLAIHGVEDRLILSPTVHFSSWDQLATLRAESRERSSEGLMLKRRNSIYQSGRKRGDWYKWKIDPLHLDMVMIYAQRGHGRRANLYSDFTFAVKNEEGKLVTLTKAYSGLTDAEFKEINKFIKQNTSEKYGPVCSVNPELVFELAFEGINKSSRNKSGYALRFPRISRWRKDKNPEEINTLADVAKLWEEIH